MCNLLTKYFIQGDTIENGIELEEPVQPKELDKSLEPVQSEGTNLQSSDSEEEFCDTSADLEVGYHIHCLLHYYSV